MSNTPSPASESSQPLAKGTMTFFEHLDELRSRLLRSIIVLVAAIVVAGIFTPQIIDYLREPYGRPLQILEPTGSVVIYFRVALMSGGILAIPFLTYQLFMFIAPGLTPREKNWVRLAIPAATGFFLLGVAFAWFIMLPAAFDFLAEFGGGSFETQWTAQSYFAFLTAVLFWLGVAFEMPIVFFVLARLGLVRPGTLIRSWRFAVVAIVVVAAVITPTVDPFNLLLVTAPLLGLYIISIFLVAVAARRIDKNIQSA